MRRAAGQTGEDVAGALGWAASKLTRIELASGHPLYIDDDAETHQYQLGFDALVRIA